MPSKDPERAREYRREYNRRLRERDPDYQKRQYQKHREKRLAGAKAKRDANIEAARERQREQYAKHREKRVEAARRYRRENAEAVNARAVERYNNNREAVNERAKERLAASSELRRRKYEQIQDWRKRNPERELLYHAKRLLNEAVGIPIRDIPLDIAEAKVEQIKLHRAAQGTSPREG